MQQYKFRVWCCKKMMYNIPITSLGSLHFSTLKQTSEYDYELHQRCDCVMMYIGINDKDNSELFEYDIVLFEGKCHVIKYFEKYAMFGLVGKSYRRKFDASEPMGSGGSSTSYKPYILSKYYQKRIEKVGNVFEDFDLLNDRIDEWHESGSDVNVDLNNYLGIEWKHYRNLI